MGFSKFAGFADFKYSDTNFSFADAPISWNHKRNKAVSLSAAAPEAILYISFL